MLSDNADKFSNTQDPTLCVEVHQEPQQDNCLLNELGNDEQSV